MLLVDENIRDGTLVGHIFECVLHGGTVVYNDISLAIH